VHGYNSVTPPLWELAGAVWAASCAVRDNYARQAAAIEEKAEADYRGKLAGREAAKAEGVAGLADQAHTQAVAQARAYLEQHPDATDGALWGKAIAGRLRKLCDRDAVLANVRTP
jgi:flagellar biosynthesis/type III secretory pathway protein FliH